MSRLTRDVAVEGLNRRVQVRELDVSEIRAHLNALGRVPDDLAEFDIPGAMLFPEVSFDDLRAMSDLTDAELGLLAPSELRPVVDAVKEVNPDFFGMRARLVKLV